MADLPDAAPGGGRGPRIALAGAGQIGGALAMLAASRRLGAEVVLYDLAAGPAAGKALDAAHAGAVLGHEVELSGGGDPSVLAGADAVVVTAGAPRRPGMSRDDLLDVNLAAMRGVGEAIAEHAPGAFVVCVTNPLDAMVWALREFSGLPPSRVAGMAGVLDAARLRFLLARELGVSPRDVSALVLGGHGDSMVPLVRLCSVGGVPLPDLVRAGMISEARVAELVEATRVGGAELVRLLGSGSAFAAPAAAAAEMVEAVVLGRRRVLPCAAWLDGEYGESGIYAGVPAVLGPGGVERVVELELEPGEREAFARSAAGVRSLVEACRARMAAGPAGATPAGGGPPAGGAGA